MVDNDVKWHVGDRVVLAGLVGFAATLGLAAILRRPDLTANEGFLFGDPALNLLVAGRLLRGEQLYTDIAFQYGPVSIWAYTGFSVLFGNAVRTYLGFLLLWSLTCVALSYALLRTRVSVSAAGLVVALGLIPTLLVPGAIAGASLSSTYLPIERAILIGVALTWTPPAERSSGRATLMGALLGLSQGVRFGTALFTGAAVVILDIVVLVGRRRSRPVVVRWIMTSLYTLAAFTAVQVIWIAFAFATLPRHAAVDFLWPRYLLDLFDLLPNDLRWGFLAGWRYFFGQLLTPVTGVIAFVGLLAWAIVRRWRSHSRSELDEQVERDMSVLLPGIFFALGTAFFFRTVWHFQQYFWTLLLPVAVVLHRWPRLARPAFAILSLPGLALVVRAMLFTTPPAHRVAFVAPTGDKLLVEPDVPRRVAEIARLADSARSQASDSSPGYVIIMPMGAGVHHFYDIPMWGRQSWYIPGYTRPVDEPRLLRALENGSSVVILDQPRDRELPRDPCTWFDYPPVPSHLCAVLSSRANTAGRIDATTWKVSWGAGGKSR